MIKDTIDSLIARYIPEKIMANYENSRVDKALEIPLNGVCTSATKGLKDLVGWYLYSKAYSCSFAEISMIAVGNIDTNLHHNLSLKMRDNFNAMINSNNFSAQHTGNVNNNYRMAYMRHLHRIGKNIINASMSPLSMTDASDVYASARSGPKYAKAIELKYPFKWETSSVFMAKMEQFLEV